MSNNFKIKRQLRLFICGCFFLLLYNFSAYSQFQVNGNASQMSCTCYQLTASVANQTGTVWNTNQIDLNNSFDFSFTVFLGCDAGVWTGADGIAFGLQPVDTLIGGVGGSMGLGGISPSLGVYIDTYNNGSVSGDIFNDHISINSNGDVNHNTANNLDGPYDLVEIEDCANHDFRIVWNATTKTLDVYFDGVLTVSHTGDIINTIFGGNPNVYWGFTGSTGGAFNEQRFCLDLTSKFSNSITAVSGCLYDSIQFFDQSTSTLGGITSWNWNFGDGTSDSIQNPFHVYDSSAYYNTILTITDASGCQAVDTIPVLVSSQQIKATTSNDTLCLGSQANLNVSLTAGLDFPCNYKLRMIDQFGDGWSGASVEVLVNGASVGVYSVSAGVLFATTIVDTLFAVNNNDNISFNFTGGAFDGDIIWELYDSNNNLVHSDGTSPTIGSNTFSTIASCPSTVNYTYLWADASVVSNSTIINPQTNITTTTSFIVSVSDNFGCDAVDTVNVFVYNVQGPGSNGSTSVCVTDTIFDMFSVLTGTPGVGGTWFNAQQDTISNLFNPTTDSTGTYTYVLDNGGVCPSSSANVSVTIFNLPNAGTNGVINICQNGLPQSMFLALGGGADSNGIWMNNLGMVVDSLFDPTVDASGFYLYIASNGVCPDSVAKVVALVNPLPSLNIAITNVSCFGGSDGEINAQGVNGTSPYVINWSNGVVGSQNTNLFIGTYNMTVTDAKGCIFDSTSVLIEPTELTYLSEKVLPTCNSSCDGKIQLNVAGGITPYTYVWSGTTKNSDSITGLCVGNYSAEVFDANNCLLPVMEITLTSTDSLVANFSQSVDSGFAPLEVYFTDKTTGIGQGTFYDWSIDPVGFSIDKNPTFIFDKAGKYSVLLVVNNPNGCVDTAESVIVVFENFIETIPVVFSPNGDRINDVFYLKINNLTAINVGIYNRWGEYINSYNLSQIGWDGTTQAGTQVPEGTYFYTVTYSTKTESNITSSGIISLLR